MLPSSFAKRLCSALPLNEDQRVLNEINCGWYEEQELKAQFGRLGCRSLCSVTCFSKAHSTNWDPPPLHPTSVVSSYEKKRACARCVLLRPHLVVTMKVNLQLMRVIKFRARHIAAAPSDHEALFRADLLRPSPWPRRLYRSAPS